MARKDTGFRIRVEKDLRETFLEVCQEKDKPAAQVLREFMRDYVARHKAALQGSLFDSSSNSNREPW